MAEPTSLVSTMTLVMQSVDIASATHVMNAMDVLGQVHAFYDSAWNRLLFVIGVFGIAWPLILLYFQNRSIDKTEENIKIQTDELKNSNIEKFDEQKKEFEKQIKEQKEKFDKQIEDQKEEFEEKIKTQKEEMLKQNEKFQKYSESISHLEANLENKTKDIDNKIIKIDFRLKEINGLYWHSECYQACYNVYNPRRCIQTAVYAIEEYKYNKNYDGIKRITIMIVKVLLEEETLELESLELLNKIIEMLKDISFADQETKNNIYSIKDYYNKKKIQ